MRGSVKKIKMKNFFLFAAILLLSVSTKLIAQNSKASKQNKIAVQERAINVDFTKSSGALNTFFKECVGAGRANEGLRADWQQQLSYVRKECGFKYIRMH